MSCATCKHSVPASEEYVYCRYPVPAWLKIALQDKAINAAMPASYSGCPCYEEYERKLMEAER